MPKAHLLPWRAGSPSLIANSNLKLSDCSSKQDTQCHSDATGQAKTLVAYAGEDSDLLIFDMSATHKGVENSFKVPGEVVSVSYTAGKYVVYYIDNLEHTGNVLILGNNDLTSEVNNLLRKTIASGSSVEAPFCANETLYVPLVNTFSNVELITYLEVDLSSGLITYNFP